MISRDNFEFAMENTRVVLAPQRRIESFGNTSFQFFLVSELMDSVDEVRVRNGRIDAERPQIMAPGHYSQLLLENFGDQAHGFAEWLRQQSENLAFLKYGFQFRKSEVTEDIVRSPVDQVIERVLEQVTASEESLSAIIHGVDEAWEVCLLKFTVDLIQQSAGGNIGDFRRKGLL